MKHPITAGCCIDVTSRQHQQKTLVLAEQPKRWVDKTALDYKQALFFFPSQMLFHALIAIFKNYISMTTYVSVGQVTTPFLVSVPKTDFTGV